MHKHIRNQIIFHGTTCVLVHFHFFVCKLRTEIMSNELVKKKKKKELYIQQSVMKIMHVIGLARYEADAVLHL